MSTQMPHYVGFDEGSTVAYAAPGHGTGIPVRWSRWRVETGEEFRARVLADAAKFGIDAVRFCNEVVK